ncbi:MAG TPA: hypothetical protein VEB66_10600 [Opitutaceae bacterium]|nr:hypothetical protein [Opitutaceae bacterium]
MKLRIPLTLMSMLVSAGLVSAQPSVPEMEETSRAIAQALEFRIGLSAAVVAGAEKPADAIERLRAAEAPRGAPGKDRQAEFAFAAVDVGHRLLSAGKPAEAEVFFSEAEKDFAQAIERVKNDDAYRAMLLQAVAYIRVTYLGKAKEAKEDLDAARKLRPDDQALAARAEFLGNDKAEVFRPGAGK